MVYSCNEKNKRRTKMTNIKDAVVLASKRKGNQSAGYFFWGMLAGALLMVSPLKAEQQDSMSASFNRTPSQYKAYAVALGQRLVKSGKERIIATGYLAHAENPGKPVQVEIIWQYPLKVRLTQEGSVLAVDRLNPALKVPADARLAETMQVLLEDSAEGLLCLRSTTGTTRHIGSGFKLPNADTKGPGIDIVQTTYADVFREGQKVAKTYWFNSETKLLGFVGYLSASGNQVDIVIDDWRDVEGEMVPFLIERWENSKLMMRLTLSSAIVTAGSEDGIFGGN
jgi:hypothetical protein